MNDSTYLLIAFHSEKEKHPGNAKRKTISRGEFQLLSEDFQVEIELNQIPHSITEKRSFSLTIAGCQHLVMIIDVKPKSV